MKTLSWIVAIAGVTVVAAACDGGDGGSGDPVVGEYRGVVAANGQTGEARLVVGEPVASAHPPQLRFVSVARAQASGSYPVMLTFFGATFTGDLASGEFEVTSSDGDRCTGEIEPDGRITTRCELGGSPPFGFVLFRSAAGGVLRTYCGSGVAGEPLALGVTPTDIVFAVVDGALRPVDVIGSDPRSIGFDGATARYEGTLDDSDVVTPTSGNWTVMACRPADTGSSMDGGVDPGTDPDAGPGDAGPGDAGSSEDAGGTDCEGPTFSIDPLEVSGGPRGGSCGGDDDLLCRGVSCCESFIVPSATYEMGRGTGEGDSDAFPDAVSDNDVPEHSVTVSRFAMDRFQVTVGRFRTFVEGLEWVPAEGSGSIDGLVNSGWRTSWDAELPSTVAAWRESLIDCRDLGTRRAQPTWTDLPAGNENRPINCVTWFEAQAFCISEGGRLPTEAEWELAAAGGDDDRLWPWGACPVAADLVSPSPVTDLPENVGAFPTGRGRWGHDDLAGSTWEWTFDYHDSDWYSGAGATCSNCANLSGGSERRRSLRGGRWDIPGIVGYTMRAAHRSLSDEDGRSPGIGFRCVRPSP